MSFLSNKSNKHSGSLLPFTPEPVFRSSSSSGPVQPSLLNLSFGSTSKQPWQRSISAPDPLFNKKSKSTGLLYCDKSAASVKPMNVHNNVPVWTESINWRNSFETHHGASRMLQQIKNYCQNKQILDIYVDHQQFEILGRYFSHHEMAEFMIRIFKLVDSDRSTLVQITRRYGSHNAFEDFYTEFMNHMQNGSVTSKTKTIKNLNSFQMPSLSLLELPTELEIPQQNKFDFLVETIEIIENGFRQEAQSAASTLAQESTLPEVIQILDKNPNLTERLISICSQSVDVLMVRCILVTLMNGLMKYNKNFKKTLIQIKDRWSSTQKLFNCQVEIFQSREITSKVDQLLNAFA